MKHSAHTALDLPAAPGTYAIILALARDRRIRIGRLGAFDFLAGHYVYIGSAQGPGGLRARVSHHMEPAPRPHWHIDYLRRLCRVKNVWTMAGERLECDWARKLSESEGTEIPVPGFGSSDCDCPAHLFRVAHGRLEPLDSGIACNRVKF